MSDLLAEPESSQKESLTPCSLSFCVLTKAISQPKCPQTAGGLRTSSSPATCTMYPPMNCSPTRPSIQAQRAVSQCPSVGRRQSRACTCIYIWIWRWLFYAPTWKWVVIMIWKWILIFMRRLGRRGILVVASDINPWKSESGFVVLCLCV